MRTNALDGTRVDGLVDGHLKWYVDGDGGPS